MQLTIILLLFILAFALTIKNIKNQKERKISMISLVLVPAILIYYLFQTFQLPKVTSFYYYISFAIFALIGIAVGVVRSRFYKYRVLDNGDIVYKRKMIDIIILLFYISFEVFIRFVFKSYEPSLFILVNTSLLFFAAASISTRRFMILLTYLKLSTRRGHV